MGIFAKFSEARMKDPVDGTAKVVSISMASADATSSNYQMDCVVSGPGIEPTAVHHTGGSAPTDRWPSPGDEIPIVIDRGNPSHFVIEWKKLPKWQTPSTLLRMTGHSFSSTLVVKASVPSEPTSRCAMLFAALRGTSASRL